MAGDCAFVVQRVLRQMLFAELELEWSQDPPLSIGWI